MSAQIALSVGGAVIGSFFGAPEIGFMLGSLAGALLFPPKGKSPQINDIRVQQSAYGQPIPTVYGTFRVAGNIIWVGQPQETDSGGKGKGPGQPKVNMSFAIALCKGPIVGVRRMWANGKLIYDTTDPTNFSNISGSASMVSNWSLYLGDELQMPDPTMQAALGAANVPAYRGLAYVVFNDLDLSPWGNYLPSFSFEVTTTAGATYYSQIQSTWTPTGTDAFGNSNTAWLACMNNLSQNGGQAFAWGWYFGYDGLHIGQVTPYGSADVFNWHPVAPGIAAEARGYCTYQSTMVAHNGWYDTNGVIHTGPYFTVAGAQFGGNEYEGSYCQTADKLYMTADYGGGNYPVTMCDTLTCTLQASTDGVLNGPMCILGATSNHVYVMCGYDFFGGTAAQFTIYQLDGTTLAIVNQWTNAAFTGADTGYILGDDFIYWTSGRNVYLFRPSQGTNTWLGLMASACRTFKVVSENLFVFSQYSYSSVAVQFGYMMTGVNPNQGVPLSTIVADICTRAGLSSGQYDVSQLTDIVTGYAITAHNAPRDSLTPLMQAYFFDVSDTDGLLKFVKRGTQPATTFLYADLGAGHTVRDQNALHPITETVVQEVDLPRSLVLKYINQASDYQESTQRAFKTTTSSNLDLAVQLAVVLSDDQALQKSQSMLWSAWVARQQFEFTTSLKYLQNEPTDVVSLQGANGQLYTARITKCQYDGNGILKWTALGEYPGLYSSTAAGGASTGFSKQTIGYSGPTILAVLDVPPLRASDTSPGLYMAACGYASNWTGCQVYDSSDGNAYTSLATITQPSTIGQVQGAALQAFRGGNIVDELSVITVKVYAGTLSSVSYTNFLSGTNAAWIGGEIVYFRNATLTGANTYQLTGFLRGQGGTEKYMNTHAKSEVFVFLDPTKMEVVNNLPSSMIGNTEYFQTYLLNQFATQTPQTQSQVIQNERIKPLNPVLFAAAHGSAGSVNDIVLSWVRRARVNYAWVDGADVALDESAETYQLKVYNGATLLRTVAVTGPFTSPTIPNYTYTAANITADGFTTGNTITFTVQQNSDQGILSDAATTTITR